MLVVSVVALAIAIAAPVAAAESPLRAGSPTASVARQGVVGADPGARPSTTPIVQGTGSVPEARTAPVKAGFRIARIRFQGNSVIPVDQLQAIARIYENRKVTLPELKRLTGEIRALYQGRGYILARAAIPPQKLRSGGDVRVVISEGRYGDVQVDGNKFYSARFIRHFFASATRAGIVQEASLQRTLLLLNELPDLQVRSLFIPGKQAGTSDVGLRVHDRAPVHVGFDYNNYGSPLVGRNRAGLALWLGNLISEADELTMRYTEPFPSNSDPLIQAGYSAYVGNDGNRVSYAYSSAATQVSGDLAILDIRGDAQIHALTWSRPMVRTLARSMNIAAGFVFKTVQNFVLGNTRVSKDDLRELTVSVDVNQVKGKTRTLASALLTQGLGDAFGGNKNGDVESSRVGSGNEFGKINGELFHVRDLGESQFLLLRFSGQLASDPLTVSEQFALGGPDSVRGYIQSDYLGDHGFTTSAEYRKGVFTSKNRKIGVQVAAFADFGHASLDTPQVGENGSRTFAGVGAGVRSSLGRTTSLRLDLGFPLLDRNSLDKDSVLYAQLVSRW